MDIFPLEVWEHIFNSQEIKLRDLLNFAQTSRAAFHLVLKNEQLWRGKFFQRWPKLKDVYNGTKVDNWLDEVKQYWEVHDRIDTFLAKSSSNYYLLEDVSRSEFEPLVRLLKEKKVYHFIVNDLSSIIHDGQPDNHLTRKYYAKQALVAVNEANLRTVWHEFLALPSDSQSLEDGAILVAKWAQADENIDARRIKDQLDRVAGRTRQIVANDNESSVSKLAAINQVLYSEMGILGNMIDYYSLDNSYLNKVLEYKTGIPITLCILYQSVAQRLGVKCDPVNFPAHFLLRWEQYPHLPEDQRYTYIDAFNKGKFLTKTGCRSLIAGDNLRDSAFSPVLPITVFERMIRNLVHVARQSADSITGLRFLTRILELCILINPRDWEAAFSLAECYIFNLHSNLEETLERLNGRLNSLYSHPDEEGLGPLAINAELVALRTSCQEAITRQKQLKIRPVHREGNGQSVQYRVGMVMRHIRYNYFCVITGWDPVCAASFQWRQHMGVARLSHGDNQPFYHVLVNDGTNRYAAEENLEPASEVTRIDHPEIGRHFCAFDGSKNCYVPNAEMAMHYPDD